MPVIDAGSYDPTDPSSPNYDPYAGVDPFRRIPKPYNPQDPLWAYGKGGGRIPMTQGVPKSLPYGNRTPLTLPGARPSMPVGTDAATGVPGTNMTTIGGGPGPLAGGGVGDGSMELGPYTPDEILSPRQPIPGFKSVGPRSSYRGPSAEFTEPAGPMSGGAPSGGGSFGGGPRGAPTGGSSTWNPMNNSPIDPEALGPSSKTTLEWSPGGPPSWFKPFTRVGALGPAAAVMAPTPAETGEAPTNMWNQRPSGLGPTEDLSSKPVVSPVVPPEVHEAVKKAAKAAAKAATQVPKTPGAPNMGYYAPHGRDREWVPYSRLPNGGADDPRIYRGPLQ